MCQLINIYNNSLHTTFYRVLKKHIIPNEMDKNKLLEDKLDVIYEPNIISDNEIMFQKFIISKHLEE